MFPPSLILLQLPMPPPAFPEFYRLSLCRKLDAQQQGSAVKGSSLRGSHHVFSPLLSHDYLQEEGVQHPGPSASPTASALISGSAHFVGMLR